jgi:hypothetical protein
MVNAPWYIRNNDLHKDLLVDFVSSEIQRFAQKHEERLHRHVNIEAIQLLDNVDIVRRLQRKNPLSASLSVSAKAVKVLEQVLVLVQMLVQEQRQCYSKY